MYLKFINVNINPPPPINYTSNWVNRPALPTNKHSLASGHTSHSKLNAVQLRSLSHIYMAKSSKADIGQSLIVSNGLCIAIETLPGTDAMIEFVSNFKNTSKKIKNVSEGIFFKSLKVNQDPRFDFPVVGEKTLRNIRNAKINGLALFKNRLILLNNEKLIKLANELDLFIFVVK